MQAVRRAHRAGRRDELMQRSSDDARGLRVALLAEHPEDVEAATAAPFAARHAVLCYMLCYTLC